MSDPRELNLPWPFVAVDEEPYVGVEVAPNEIVWVVLAGDYRAIYDQFRELRQAAFDTIDAANRVINAHQQL